MYVSLTTPLRQMVNEQGMKNLKAELIWTPETEQAFITLKTQMAHAAHLNCADYSLGFFWMYLRQETVHMGSYFKNRQGPDEF